VSRRLVGVDLGGTLIRAALATGPATHQPPVRHPTPRGATPGELLDAVAVAVREASGGAAPDGVGIGIPGPLDPSGGRVFAAPNLHGWTDVPARDMLQERVGCPVAIQNDANLAGFAEWIAGAGAGTRDMVFVTASTGVGGGLVLGGELYSGVSNSAAEIGHAMIDPDGPPCGQGHRGCLEGSASGTAIARKARELLGEGRPSSLASLAPETVDARAVADAAAAGDALAIELYREAGRYLGWAIGGLLNLLSPQAVVIGGGLINAGELLLAPLREAVADIAFDAPRSHCRIVPAALGTDAGLVGAVAWAVRCFGERAGVAAAG
jgi:glucokinase